MRARNRNADRSPVGRTTLLGQLSQPLRQYLSTEAGSAWLLLAASLVALIWANSPVSGAYETLWSTHLTIGLGDHELSMTLAHWVNDGLMALFFFVIGLEVRQEFSVGALTDWRRASLPALAGLGGIVLPALIFLLVAPAGSRDGWGLVIGTDTAFMLGALAVVGPTFSTQLRIFLLTLTVIDDIVAVSVIGLAYSDELRPWLLVAMAIIATALASLDRFGIWRVWPYAILFVALWAATMGAGLHATIAGMLAGLLIRAHRPKRSTVERAVDEARAFRQSPQVELGKSTRQGVAKAISVNQRMQSALHPWTSYVIVPLFALANAGVDLRNGVLSTALHSRLTWAVVLGLVVGKTLGIFVTTMLGRRLGLGDLPRGVGAGHVFGGAALSGIGFTVSLLIASLAFRHDEALRGEAIVGVFIAAVLSVALGALAFLAAARLRGETDADLPRTLFPDVDPERDHIRGDPAAPLTIVEYADFECPFCGRTTGIVADLRRRFGDRLRYVFRHLPLPDVHPAAESAARAAEAAGEQGRFWEMADVLFAHQDQLEYEDLAGYAGDLGLDVEAFLRDMESDEIAERIRRHVAGAEASGATGTPTFFIEGRRHTGPNDSGSLARELEIAASAADPA